MAEAALLAHIVSQIESNVNFLVSENYLTAADASAITSRLSGLGSTPAPAPARSIPASRAAPRAAVPASPAVQKVKALWAYNVNGEDHNDLTFAEGDIIELVSSENDDWWTGKIDGRQGLFPSTYVERLPAEAEEPAAPPYAARAVPPRSVPPTVAGGRSVPPRSPGSEKSKTPYRPFGAVHQGSDQPPAAPGAVNSIGLQEASGQAEKKSKFGKYGNTMAHSAAGGAGFAIGNGLVRSIF